MLIKLAAGPFADLLQPVDRAGLIAGLSDVVLGKADISAGHGQVLVTQDGLQTKRVAPPFRNSMAKECLSP